MPDTAATLRQPLTAVTKQPAYRVSFDMTAENKYCRPRDIRFLLAWEYSRSELGSERCLSPRAVLCFATTQDIELDRNTDAGVGGNKLAALSSKTQIARTTPSSSPCPRAIIALKKALQYVTKREDYYCCTHTVTVFSDCANARKALSEPR